MCWGLLELELNFSILMPLNDSLLKIGVCGCIGVGRGEEGPTQ